jgi:hypothetical protein
MDILKVLDDRLAFIRFFYFTASEPFELIRREYIRVKGPSDDDAPDQFDEWQRATKGLEVIGQCSVGLVAKAIEDYLRQFVLRQVGKMPSLSGKSRFEKYEKFLLTNTAFNWGACPIGRDRIEQINLCRNDFQHDPSIDSDQPKQTDQHFQKYPLPRFHDLLERAILMAVAETDGKDFEDAPASLTVTRAGLLSAMTDARRFCEFVEAQRTNKP